MNLKYLVLLLNKRWIRCFLCWYSTNQTTLIWDRNNRGRKNHSFGNWNSAFPVNLCGDSYRVNLKQQLLPEELYRTKSTFSNFTLYIAQGTMRRTTKSVMIKDKNMKSLYSNLVNILRILLKAWRVHMLKHYLLWGRVMSTCWYGVEPEQVDSWSSASSIQILLFQCLIYCCMAKLRSKRDYLNKKFSFCNFWMIFTLCSIIKANIELTKKLSSYVTIKV